MKEIIYPAGLFRRVAAAFYDTLLLLAVLFGAAVVVLLLRHGDAVPPGTLWFEAYLLSIAFFFFAWFWTHGGQTLGMRAWRLQVRSTDGGPVNWLQAIRRYVTGFVSWLCLIGILWSLFDRQRRAWHDLLSGTEVVVLPRNTPKTN